jgi:serine/threonine protein kinase
MSSLLGTTLDDRYRLEEWLGAGGMSTVYRALDQRLQREVAVKLMHQEIAEDGGQLERFRREARAVAKLSDSPHVVGVIDAGEDHGRAYIVFEYVKGETLRDRIRREGRLGIDESIDVTIAIARALSVAHAAGIVHRDVKPHNVMLAATGEIKVTDFGIARTREEEGLTADGRVIGTTDYVSPEQASGEAVTPCSDIYSLGIVLFEMLTGRVPFRGESQVAVAMKHIQEPLPDPRSDRPEITPALARVVTKATAKEPDDRYQNDSALIADLLLARDSQQDYVQPTDDEITAEIPAASPRHPRTRTDKRRRGQRDPASHHRGRIVALGALALAVLAAAVVAVTSLTGKGGSSRRADAATPSGKPIPVKLCAACAYAYNPDGFGGDTSQNDSQAPLALDGSATTVWSTDYYYSGSLNKPGVGLYVDARSEVRARTLKLVTTTSGFAATIYGSRTAPSATSFRASGWHELARTSDVGTHASLTLAARGGSYRYFLVWITKLPPASEYATIAALRLLR